MTTTDAWIDEYRSDAFESIAGWLAPGALDLLRAVGRVQDELRVDGGVAEIGIYRGRFFIAMNGLVHDGSIRSIAIDLFAAQHLNIDSSGYGDADAFRANLERYDRHEGSNVELLSADSTTLTPSDILAHLPQRPRIFSVDGGHTPEHTISDLRLAAAVVSPQGIVFLDDILNAHWLGVIEGTVHYLDEQPTLWPVAIGHNKLLLCPMSMHAIYRERLAKQMEFRKTVRLCGYDLLAT
jgi:Methyltransferase domain